MSNRSTTTLSEINFYFRSTFIFSLHIFVPTKLLTFHILFLVNLNFQMNKYPFSNCKCKPLTAIVFIPIKLHIFQCKLDGAYIWHCMPRVQLKQSPPNAPNINFTKTIALSIRLTIKMHKICPFIQWTFANMKKNNKVTYPKSRLK